MTERTVHHTTNAAVCATELPVVLSSPEDVHPQFLNGITEMPFARAVLMCAPHHFDVVDVKNPFMADSVGSVDRKKAQAQWEEVRGVFEKLGVKVELVAPIAGCEDMVFTANPAFAGLDDLGNLVCVLSRMRFPSRQREVRTIGKWFEHEGYAVVEASPPDSYFEGGGDAIWHPRRAMIWGGYGQRSDSNAYSEISALFGVPVILLELTSERFYHLDTCFCPIDETTVLVHAPALTREGNEIIRRVFANVIGVDETEAKEFMACNAAAVFGKHVIIQRGAVHTTRELRTRGFHVHEIDTGEFIKSGGSVFCMKALFY